MRSAAGVNHPAVMILEFGMILCDVAGSSSGDSGTAALCISSNKVWKVPGQFLHSISHAKGKGRGEKKPHAVFKAGKEANWSTLLRP